MPGDIYSDLSFLRPGSLLVSNYAWRPLNCSGDEDTHLVLLSQFIGMCATLRGA